MAALAEAVAFAEDTGIGKAQILDILASGAGNSLVLSVPKREKLLSEDFTNSHFSSALIYKDLHHIQVLARTLKKPLFTGKIAKELFALTMNEEMEQLDFSVIYRVMKRM